MADPYEEAEGYATAAKETSDDSDEIDSEAESDYEEKSFGLLQSANTGCAIETAPSAVPSAPGRRSKTTSSRISSSTPMASVSPTAATPESVLATVHLLDLSGPIHLLLTTLPLSRTNQLRLNYSSCMLFHQSRAVKLSNAYLPACVLKYRVDLNCADTIHAMN
ncbi:hypothetical protein GUJ93_ZPchr0005g14662 [Zizania palustris]|uniref:Uncharacterized protein n=1 Tax=Zizania palustris TaxID=103762 RepID=A0A8J5TA19_ZIZPA|nr:hypothetical protein GUJ93_ZPchr0005g14662 [Zizania palustris]